MKYKIGDRFRLLSDVSEQYLWNKGVLKFLETKAFTIVKLIDSPHYLYATDIETKGNNNYPFNETELDNYFIKVDDVQKLKKLIR